MQQYYFEIIQVEYRIKWENYSHRHNTWEPYTNLINCQHAIDEFELKWAKEIFAMKKDRTEYMFMIRPTNIIPSTSTNEGFLVNLNDDDTPSNTVSTNIQKIYKDLEGINFDSPCVSAAAKRPIPKLEPIVRGEFAKKSCIIKGDAAKIIMNRIGEKSIERHPDMDMDSFEVDFSDLRYSSDSDWKKIPFITFKYIRHESMTIFNKEFIWKKNKKCFLNCLKSWKEDWLTFIRIEFILFWFKICQSDPKMILFRPKICRFKNDSSLFWKQATQKCFVFWLKISRTILFWFNYFWIDRFWAKKESFERKNN